ncbi:uncharacterized protein HD556DRAFT_510591 [Suillus plorans]|uniref:Uncharacterized protein n=1 Tax=Suillus plorans TaxID=116603 RepID=A0A9P7AP17_9AGAM|nr:uncharacterized protein HD556DRAFT_510591 [Suillus plorans]KAG1793518.1 hypothetical protein HD556DRAFT_510591 [Suillus plorans]
MADALSRVLARLQNLPVMSLPTDYPRSTGANKLIEAAHLADLSEQTSLSLLKLALHAESEDGGEDENKTSETKPSAFHLFLSAFLVLLHRYMNVLRTLPRGKRSALGACCTWWV